MQLSNHLITYINGRASSAGLSLTVQEIVFPSAEELLVNCEATKFGISVALRLTGRLKTEGSELLISQIEVAPQDGDSGMLKRKVIDWFSSAVLWKWGDALVEHGIRMSR